MTRVLTSIIGLMSCIGILAGSTLAQTPDAVLDALVDDAESMSDRTRAQLRDWIERPLDINAAEARDLSRLPGLTPQIAARIVAERETHGPYAAVDALTRVPGVTPEVLRTLRPFLTTRPDLPNETNWRKDVQAHWMQTWSRRLDVGAGYRADSTGSAYQGSPDRLTTRLRVDAGDRVTLKGALDKDPGEAMQWAPEQQTYGFDHASGGIALRDWGPIATVVAGDFTASFGQGLILWDGGGFGKGRDPIGSVVRAGRGLRVAGSAEENQFFRGLGVTVRLPTGPLPGRLHATAFASRRRLDATLATPAGAEASAGVRTLGTTGLHRTVSEQARKDAVRSTTGGGAVTWSSDGVHVGVVGVTNALSDPLLPRDVPYDRYSLRGRHFQGIGLFGSATRSAVHVFGDVARTSSGAIGSVGGVTYDAGRRVEATLALRHYPARFATLHGNGFGERRATQNESGVYVGLRLQAAPTWTVAGYVDHYRFPWLRYTVGRPSHGVDARLLVQHTPRRWLEQYVQFRAETKGEGADVPDAAGRSFDGLQRRTRQSLRWHVTYAFSDALTLRTRVEGVRSGTSGEAVSGGVLFYQDVQWTPRAKLRLDARLAFFDTDDFDARVYAYEYDVRYGFSIPALHGQGRRGYVLARYTPWPGLTLETRYAVTTWPQRRQMGAGRDEVTGNRIRDVRIQLQWRSSK